MKKMGFLLVTVFVLSLFVGLHPVSAQSKTPVVKLKIADMLPATATCSRFLDWWANEVEKKSNGRIKIERYFGGSLVGAYEQLTSVKTGIIHVTPYYSGYHPDIAPLPLIGLMPMMHRGTIKEAMLASDDFYKNNQAMLAEFKKNNVKYLFPTYNSNNYIWSRTPVNNLGDLKGKSFRAFGPFLTFFKELGAGVVSLAVPEVYEAMERGAVNGTMNYLANAMGTRYFEIIKYANITELGHNVGCPAVMHLGTWNKIPKDLQEVIEEVNSRSIQKGVELQVEDYKRDMKLVKDHKMMTSEFTKEEIDRMVDLAKNKVWLPYAQNLEKKGLQGTKIMQEYISTVEKYRKK